MGSVTSTLTMRMVDGVSAPAAKARGALNNLNSSASRLAAQSGRGGVFGPGGTAGAFLAGGGSMLLGAAATYMTVGAVKDAYLDAANFDRRLTRIRLTADASREAAGRLREVIRSTAQETALPIKAVTDGVEALVAQGKTLPEALAFLPSVARTAQASGAEVADMANTAGAIQDSMKIPIGEMQRAFDILVTAGKAGKFELRDMARELPGLAPMAAAVGLEGTDGLRNLAAMLQIVRNQTGTAGEAATNLANLFQKMETEETVNKFKKFGIDLRKEMAKARKEGRSVLETFLQLADQATKGDLSKLPQLIADMQFANATRAILSQRDALRKLSGSLRNVDGATMKDLREVTYDSAAAATRLGNAWDTFKNSLAGLADTGGASTFLEQIAAGADRAARDLMTLNQAIRDHGVLTGTGKWIEEQKREMDQKGERIPDKVVEDARRRYENEQIAKNFPAMIEQRQKILDAFDKANQGRTLAPEVAAKRDQRMKELADLRRRYGEAVEATNPVPLAQGPTGVPPELRYRDRGWRGKSAPSSKTFDHDFIGPPQAPPVESSLIIQLDDASLHNAAGTAIQRVQAIFNSNPPVIRPRVDMPSMSYSVGQRVSDSVNGGLSDNGARR